MSNDSENSNSPIGDEVATAYRQHYTLLEYLAVHRFHVPSDDARNVIHDVFLAFIRNHVRIRDPRAWLVGAMCIECRLYWRRQDTDEDRLRELDDEIEAIATAEDIATRIYVSALLRELPERCRELLRLRFFEEYSSQEIARRFSTTVDYARKMLHRCLARARALFMRRSS